MGSNKRLAINMVANMIAFVVQFGVNFVLTPYIVGQLGSEAYSFVPMSTNLVAYVNIVTTALNSMSSRFISIEMNKGNLERANEYFNSVLVANIVIAVMLTVPSVLLVVYASRIFDIPLGLVNDVQLTISFVALSTLINLIFNVFGNAFFIRNRLDISAKRNIEGNIVRIVVLLGLFAAFKPRIYYITATTLIVSVYVCMTNVYYTKKLTPELTINRNKFNINAIKELLSSGIWNSVNQLSVTLLTTLDLYLANIILGATAGGIYAIAKTIPNFIQNVVSMLVNVFMPQFTILYAQEKKDELVESIGLSIKVMGWLITLPIGFLIVFGDVFFQLWVPGQDSQLLHGLSLLTIIPMIVTGSINTIFNVYTLTNKLKTPALVLLVTGIVNTFCVVLCAKFTPLGIWSIPLVSAVIGILRNLLFTPVYAAKCLNVSSKVFYYAIVRGSLCAVVMIIICSIYKILIPVSGWISMILSAGICALITMSINVLLVFKKDERAVVRKMILSKLHKN